MRGKSKKRSKVRAASTRRKASPPKKTRSKLAKTRRTRPSRTIKTKRRGQTKTTRRKSNRGYGSKIRVESKALKQRITINRRVTRLARDVNPKSEREMNRLRPNLKSIVSKHHTMLGRSKGSLYYLRLEYTAKIKGKKINAGFSLPIAKLKNKAQLEAYLETLIDAFEDSISGYLQRGFSGIKITGISVQGYS